ncbi:MAG: uroporphyrinogen decarboxylase family protein [Tissierellia bacterium]|nr:uroporphyrinogen decarboxylase family protein [Tissierellia bacterium]MDD4779536.1 uroporphyrinogen decarboxylase family protein [Tissierellia bacterium]
MAVDNIFKCTGNEIESIPDSILEELSMFSMSYEEINNNASYIAKLSKALKEYKNNKYCELPFCHTVEAEAFGSTVNFDHKYGNRIGVYVIKDINLIEDIKNIDLGTGRIYEVLKAISILKKNGENVILNVTGPITIATSILDSQLLFRAIRKDAEKVNQLLEKIENGIINYILEGINYGVDIVSFADPAGTIDIVGPKVYKEVSGKFTYNILKKLEEQLGGTIIHICGKTSTSLESIGLLDTENLHVDGDNYFDMIENISKNNIKFIGHWCLKLNRKNSIISKCILK